VGGGRVEWEKKGRVRREVMATHLQKTTKLKLFEAVNTPEIRKNIAIH